MGLGQVVFAAFRAKSGQCSVRWGLVFLTGLLQNLEHLELKASSLGLTVWVESLLKVRPQQIAIQPREREESARVKGLEHGCMGRTA